MTDQTVSPSAAEREPDNVTPERIHFDAGRLDQHAACGYDLDRNGPEGWTTDRAQVTCAECAGKLVDEQLAEPERRTVSLEVLTAELLRFVSPHTYTELLVATTVGIVLRVSGEPVAVPETDVDWPREHRQPADVLAQMLQQARFYASDAGDAELLMPTPDVLAALDDRPDAQLLTAPVWVLAMDVKPGHLLVGEVDGKEYLELVVAVEDCEDAGCINGATCVVLSIEQGVFTEPSHSNGYSRTEVRIPASVTR